MIQRLHDFEEKAFYEYNHELQISQNEKMEEKVSQTSNKLVFFCFSPTSLQFTTKK
jgi:hypothetical protein